MALAFHVQIMGSVAKRHQAAFKVPSSGQRNMLEACGRSL